ncbi:hypothetical protein pb186bvf_000324 [Paramecium bursaria]
MNVVSGQSGINNAQNNYAQQKKHIFSKIDQHPETAPTFSKTYSGDLQFQMAELQIKYQQLEQAQLKMHQTIKQQSDLIQQQQQNKNELISSYQITEIKKIVNNILEQNKIPQINQQQQKVYQDIAQINLNINKNQQQITNIQQVIEQLKTDGSKKNLNHNNEQIMREFQQFKEQLTQNLQSQIIKIYDEIKNNLSQSSVQQKMSSIQQQILKIQEDQKNNLSKSNVQQQQQPQQQQPLQQQLQQQQQQQQQIQIQQIKNELIDLKNKVEQMNQQNYKGTIDKKTLDHLTKQEIMFNQSYPVNSKDFGSSSKDLGASIKDMSNPGQYEKISKLLVSAYRGSEQNQSPGKTQFSTIDLTKKQSIQRQQSEKEKVKTNISNCSSMHDISYTCFLCQIQTSENFRQTSCGHVYHNNCYRKLLEKQISQQKGYVKCSCNSVLLQSDILLDLKDSYFKMQELFICQKYSNYMKKCKNFEKCNQFWLNDSTNITDICQECQQDKSLIRQPNYLKNQQQANQSAYQPSQFNQQSQFQQKQQSQPSSQKQIFSQDQQPKQGTSSQIKTQHPGIKILGFTAVNQRQ